MSNSALPWDKALQAIADGLSGDDLGRLREFYEQGASRNGDTLSGREVLDDLKRIDLISEGNVSLLQNFLRAINKIDLATLLNEFKAKSDESSESSASESDIDDGGSKSSSGDTEESNDTSDDDQGSSSGDSEAEMSSASSEVSSYSSTNEDTSDDLARVELHVLKNREELESSNDESSGSSDNSSGSGESEQSDQESDAAMSSESIDIVIEGESDGLSEESSGDEIAILDDTEIDTTKLIKMLKKSGKPSEEIFEEVIKVSDGSQLTEEIVRGILANENLVQVMYRDIVDELHGDLFYERICGWFENSQSQSRLLAISLIPILLWSYISKGIILQSGAEREESCLLGIYNFYARSISYRITHNLPALKMPSIYHSAIEFEVPEARRPGALSEEGLRRQAKQSVSQEFLEHIPLANSIPLAPLYALPPVAPILVHLFVGVMSRFGPELHSLFLELCERLLFFKDAFVMDLWRIPSPPEVGSPNVLNPRLCRELIDGLKFLLPFEEFRERVIAIAKEMRERAKLYCFSSTYLLTCAFLDLSANPESESPDPSLIKFSV